MAVVCVCRLSRQLRVIPAAQSESRALYGLDPLSLAQARLLLVHQHLRVSRAEMARFVQLVHGQPVCAHARLSRFAPCWLAPWQHCLAALPNPDGLPVSPHCSWRSRTPIAPLSCRRTLLSPLPAAQTHASWYVASLLPLDSSLCEPGE